MSVQAGRTRWGGSADDGPTEGYFRVAARDGVFWLVDPDGGRFLSKGINTVRFDQDRIRDSDRIPYAEACRRKYGSEDAWRAAAAARLSRWGFNTLGAWSDTAVAAQAPSPLALTPNLDLGMSHAWRTEGETRPAFPDVFDPDFARHVQDRARDLCAPHRAERGIIGWFIDNELRWGPDWRGPDDLLTLFVNLPAASPGRAAAIALLRQRHPDFAAFNAAWRTPARDWDSFAALARVTPPFQRKPPYEETDAGTDADPQRAAFIADSDAFQALVAECYFALAAAAIRAADPNHLVLGSRFAYVPPRAVIEAAGRHCDVISFNCYGFDADAAIDAYAVTGKPCLIGEFSFRGADSGLPNTNGAGPLVANQAERAACFRRYVTAALRKPTVIGYHWFEHADQPAEGRFDGENSNFGTVTIADDVYETLTQAMTTVNAEAEALHTGAVA